MKILILLHWMATMAIPTFSTIQCMMNHNETGSIKFNCNWIEAEPIEDKTIIEINHWRNILFNYKLIGVYPNGIGYGNISIRLNDKEFLISGTSTGHLETLTNQHYSIVTSYDFAANRS